MRSSRPSSPKGGGIFVKRPAAAELTICRRTRGVLMVGTKTQLKTKCEPDVTPPKSASRNTEAKQSCEAASPTILCHSRSTDCSRELSNLVSTHYMAHPLFNCFNTGRKCDRQNCKDPDPKRIALVTSSFVQSCAVHQVEFGKNLCRRKGK